MGDQWTKQHTLCRQEMCRSPQACNEFGPQQLAVGLAIHQSIRSKEMVNMLHGFGMSVEYNRLLRVESQIEASVLKRGCSFVAQHYQDGTY